MKWEIDKSFSFAYGHRVWSQELNADFTGSEGTCLACRHLHGHEGLIKVHLSATELTKGMVVDFKMLGWFKDFIDDVLDHKMILDINDPLLPYEADEICTDEEFDPSLCIFHDFGGYWTPDLEHFETLGYPQAVYEKYEGLVFVDFIPTSENLSAWLLEIAQAKMAKLGVKVTAVEFWETPKSHCRVDA